MEHADIGLSSGHGTGSSVEYLLNKSYPQICQERLGNNRILYTDAGMKALRIGQQRNEQLRKSAWQTSIYGQKFMEREKQLFGYYGMGTLEKNGWILGGVVFYTPKKSICIVWILFNFCHFISRCFHIRY